MDTEGVSHGARPQAGAIDPAAMADPTERWLVTKGSLDYGPFSLAQLIEQIRTDAIEPGHVILDNETGERHFAEQHPYFGAMVEEARRLRDDRRRTNAELVHSKRSKQRSVLLIGLIGAGVAALGIVTYLLVSSADEATTDGPQGVSAVAAGELQAKINFPTTPKSTKSSGRNRRTASGSDTLALDLSEGGGSERLSNQQINTAVQRHGSRLGRCLQQSGSRRAQIEFIVPGPTGKVSWVKVNGQQSGGLYDCINRAMRAIKFPTVDGARTRAEFEMEI